MSYPHDYTEGMTVKELIVFYTASAAMYRRTAETLDTYGFPKSANNYRDLAKVHGTICAALRKIEESGVVNLTE